MRVDDRTFGCVWLSVSSVGDTVSIALGRPLLIRGEPCLGPVTRAGCDAWCPNSRAGCWGCRGPAADPNVDQLREIMKKHGFSEETLMDRLECFGGFSAYTEAFRKNPEMKKEDK